MFHASYYWRGPQLLKGCGCLGFLSPMHKKIPDSYSKKRRGQPREFWSLVLTIDGSTLLQDCVEDLLCRTQRNWKNLQKKIYIYNHLGVLLTPLVTTTRSSQTDSLLSIAILHLQQLVQMAFCDFCYLKFK